MYVQLQVYQIHTGIFSLQELQSIWHNICLIIYVELQSTLKSVKILISIVHCTYSCLKDIDIIEILMTFRQLWFHTRSTGGAIKDWRVKSHWHGSLRCDISSCLLYLSILWCKCCWDKQLNLLRTSFRWSFTCIFEHAVYWDTTLYFTYSLVQRYTCIWLPLHGYSIANHPVFRLQVMNCKTRL